MKKRELNSYGFPDQEMAVLEEPNGSRISSYKDLWIWTESILLVKTIYRVSRNLPENERFGLVSQLRRAAVSVPSNIAEGWGRNKQGYLLQGLSIARGSLMEVETQLHICADLEFLSRDEVEPIISTINKISSGILSFMNKVESK